MSQINLQDGLEALYTFDDVDYDGGRGIYRDRSGNGRHLTLNGGVTTGQSSPVGEAASFDGSDDYGSAPAPLTNNSPYAVGVIFNADSVSSNQYLIDTNDGTNGWVIEVTSAGNLRFRHRDDTGVSQEVKTAIQSNKWYRGLAWWDGSDIHLTVNGTLSDTASVSTHNPPTVNAAVCNNGGGGLLFGGDIAFAGVWSRSPTSSEVTFFNQLTARQVSLL